MPPIDDDPANFEEAVRAFRKRVPMPDWQWDALTQAEREFAFKVSGVAQADLVTEAWEAIDRALRDGTTLDDFKREVGDELEAAWGKADPARLETIFRTNTQTAYNGGRHAILSDPEVRKSRPFLRWDGAADARACEDCDPLDGMVLPADDPFWHTHQPPLHHQCRCMVTPLSDEEADDEGVTPRHEIPDVEVAEGFGRAPTVGGDWEPNPADYPAPIAAALHEKLRDAGE